MNNNFKVEIDFYDILTDQPEDGELVLIVLKKDTNPYSVISRLHLIKEDSDGQKIISARAKIYKTVPAKFIHREYYTYTFTPDDIVCWGRIKQS